MGEYKHIVEIWEYERGWGSKCFDVLSFNTEHEAIAKVFEVNSKNTEASAPDYYIQAKYIGINQVKEKIK